MQNPNTITLKAMASATITEEDASESSYQPLYQKTNGEEDRDPFFERTPAILVPGN